MAGVSDLEIEKLKLEVEDLRMRVERHLKRDDEEHGMLRADLRLKNRQHGTEIWKVVLATAVATAVFGGFLLTLATRLVAGMTQ